MVRKYKKILLLIILVLSVFSFTFFSMKKSKMSTSLKDIKSYNEVVSGEENIEGTEYVTFDAFFLKDTDSDDEAESYRGSLIKVGNKDKLYFDLRVIGDVTLKNGVIEFRNRNVKLSGTIPKNNVVTKTVSDTNFTKINLSNVSNGTSSLFSLDVLPQISNNLNSFSATNEVVLKGTVVDNTTGEETEIEKHVEYVVDSYATGLSASISSANDNTDVNSTEVIYEIITEESSDSMPLKEAHLEGVISNLDGNHPTSVRIYGMNNKEVEYEYDETTQKFNAVQRAVINENNTITEQAYNLRNKNIRTNKWYIAVTYPYDNNILHATSSVNVSAWYIGYSNSDLDEVRSNTVSKFISHEYNTDDSGDSFGFEDDSKIFIGDYSTSQDKYFIDKSAIENVYLGLTNDNLVYKERWNLVTLYGNKGHAEFTEYGTNLGNSRNISNYITYKSVRLVKGSDFNNKSHITIMDANTNETLIVLNKNNWDETISFPENVHKIKVVVSDYAKGKKSDFNLNFVKELDTNSLVSHIDMTEFANYSNIRNSITFTGYNFESGEPTNSLGRTGSAILGDVTSYIRVTMDKTSYTRELEETSIPMQIVVYPNTLDVSTKLWTEGLFLIKLPKSIIDVENLQINTYSEIISSEVISKNGQKFIKIISKNNSTNTNPYFDIRMNSVIDPKTSTTNDKLEVYGINKNPTIYSNGKRDVYDLDEDLNTQENIAYDSYNFSIVAPSELLTGAILKNYDNKGSETVSPLIADVSPLRDSSDALLEVFILNNSDNNITNISLIGQVGFIGNKYQVGTGSLGSQFDVEMSGPINIPSELSGRVHVYYSENENATKDLSDTNNGWIDNPNDYSRVKTYLIVLDEDVVLNKGSEYTFSYPIETPNTTENIGKVTYFNHGVYFDYITEAGRYSSAVSSAKLGLRLNVRYDLKINLYKKYTDDKINNSRYVLTDDEGNKSTITINSLGFGYIEGLYVGKEYKLVQNSVDKKYRIDTEEKTFKIELDDSDNLVVTHDGEMRNINLSNDNVLNIDLENDILYTLDLYDIDFVNENPIKNSIFKVTGANHENGTTIKTNSEGHAYLNNMVLNEVYKVDQIDVYDYVKVNSFNIKVVRDKETNNLKIGVEKIPTIEVGNSCNSRYTFTEESDGAKLASEKEIDTSYRTLNCNLKIDLSEYDENYTLSGRYSIFDYYYSSNNMYLKLSLVQDLEDTAATPFLTIYRPFTDNSWWNYSNDFRTNKAYVKNNNSFVQKDLKGGAVYNLYVNYYRGRGTSTLYYNPALTLDRMKIVNSSGKNELVGVEETENVHPKDNEFVYQSIDNYLVDDTTNPILHVKVTNKKIDKFKFIINKVDDQGNPIEGVQFIISGPGIPGNGKYITTDSNGLGTVDLYTSYSGSYNQLPGLNNYNYPKENYYTLEELSAPEGYSKNTKKIIFKGNIKVNSVDDLDYSIVYKNTSETKFKEYNIDDNTKDFNGVVVNYPVVSITKTDEETNEILPNTYYVINEVKRENGQETISPAKDSNGNYIGDSLVIDDIEYRVIKTDNNGEIKLNLPAGQYQLREIQAADLKYEISDEIHYFGVGETIPYQAEGINILKAVRLVTSHSTNVKLPLILKTNDNGYAVLETRESYNDYPVLTKYNSNFEVEWTTTIRIPTTTYNIVTYTDDPDRVETPYNPNSPSYSNEYTEPAFSEEDDGFYVSIANIRFAKINKETGELIFTSDDSIPYKYNYNYKHICTIRNGYSYSDYLLAGDNQYYCAYDYYHENQFDYGSTVTFDSNSNGFAFIAGLYSNNSTSNENVADGDEVYNYERKEEYVIRLADGTYVPKTKNGFEAFLIKGDSDGNIISATSINDKIIEARNKYVHDNNIEGVNDWTSLSLGLGTNTVTKTKYLDDGSFILVGDSNEDFIVKFNPEGEVEYYVPIGYNGKSAYISTDSNRNTVGIGEDGTVYVYQKSSSLGKLGTEKLYLAKPTLFDDTEDFYSSSTYGYSGTSILVFKDGKLDNIVETARTMNRNESDIDFNNDFRRIYVYPNKTIATRTDGGFIIISDYSGGGNSDNYRKLILNSGEEILIDRNTKTIIYKVNDDSSVEWIKQYKNQLNQSSTFSVKNMQDDLFMFPMIGNDTKFVNAVTNEEIDFENQGVTSNIGLVILQKTDAINPSGPDQIVLNLTNKRKVFNINVDSNEKGTFIVTSKDEELYTGRKPGKVEEVKYGDSTKNTIKVIPDTGYGVTSVTINDTPASFKVLDDGSVIIDTITDVKEEKNIYVTFTLGSSRVVVHHYLNGTTTRVASDDVLVGEINSDYVTIPKINKLYSLTKDSNDEYIMPDNYVGKFKTTPITVIYYYDINQVDLVVNYLLENTETSLADSLIKSFDIGSEYITKALDIKHYKVTAVSGEEEGILDEDKEVNYYYNRLDISHLTVKYIDKDTEENLIDSITRDLEVDSYYETEELTEVPEGYVFDSKTDNYKGYAENENIEVIYTYKKNTDSNSNSNTTSNSNSNSNSNKEVKDAEENPKTYDGMFNFLTILIISILGILITSILRKRINE